jgi:hypothetical protein
MLDLARYTENTIEITITATVTNSDETVTTSTKTYSPSVSPQLIITEEKLIEDATNSTTNSTEEADVIDAET